MLYADMNGGLAVTTDLPRMLIYPVWRRGDHRKADIPKSIFTKVLAAELRPDQIDQPLRYDLPDQIPESLVEQTPAGG